MNFLCMESGEENNTTISLEQKWNLSHYLESLFCVCRHVLEMQRNRAYKENLRFKTSFE